MINLVVGHEVEFSLLKGNHFKDKGNEALRAGKFQEAVDNYTKALELEPENAVYYSNRSAAYAKLEDFNKSADDGQKAIELKPDWAKVMNASVVKLSLIIGFVSDCAI